MNLWNHYRVRHMRQRIRNILFEATDFKDRPNINDKFWKWFGKSIAVDEQGNPMVMYRGAMHDEGSKLTKNKYFIYLSPMLSYAKNFVQRGVAKNISPYYVKTEHPLDMRSFGDGKNRRWEIYKFLEEKGVDVSELFQQYGFNSETGWYPVSEKESKKWLMYKDTFVWELFRYEKSSFFEKSNMNMMERIVNAGYDGIIWYEKLTGDMRGENYYGEAYVVLNSRQIKSIYNSGTWNPNNPDVTK
jgi:hypothetical protein